MTPYLLLADKKTPIEQKQLMVGSFPMVEGGINPWFTCDQGMVKRLKDTIPKKYMSALFIDYLKFKKTEAEGLTRESGCDLWSKEYDPHYEDAYAVWLGADRTILDKHPYATRIYEKFSSSSSNQVLKSFLDSFKSNNSVSSYKPSFSSYFFTQIHDGLQEIYHRLCSYGVQDDDAKGGSVNQHALMAFLDLRFKKSKDLQQIGIYELSGKFKPLSFFKIHQPELEDLTPVVPSLTESKEAVSDLIKDHWKTGGRSTVAPLIIQKYPRLYTSLAGILKNLEDDPHEDVFNGLTVTFESDEASPEKQPAKTQNVEISYFVDVEEFYAFMIEKLSNKTSEAEDHFIQNQRVNSTSEEEDSVDPSRIKLERI